MACVGSFAGRRGKFVAVVDRVQATHQLLAMFLARLHLLLGDYLKQPNEPAGKRCEVVRIL
jgi:hypothetical protein